MAKRLVRVSRALIWLPACIALAGVFFTPQVFATTEPGIDVTVYNNFGYNGSPPLPNVSGRPSVGTTTVNQINQDFDSEPMFGMYEDFIVKYEGYITSPVTGDITFYPYADDGTKFYLDGLLIDNNWVDKGGGGNPTPPQSFVAGVSKPFTYWYYENGGGANTQLFWDTGEGFEMVPATAFTKSAVPTTTTTTTIAPYLNPPQNLTAIANPDGSVDLDWDAPEASNVDIYAYSVSFYDLTVIGGAASGGWGVWTNQGTNYSLAEYMFSGSNPVTTGYGPVRFGVKAGNQSCFSAEGEGPCIYGQEVTVDANVFDPTPTTTTTTSTTTTTIIEEEVPEWTTTTVLTPPATVTTTEPEVETPPSESYPEADGPAASVPQYAPEQETTTQTDEPSIVVPEAVQDAADVAVEDIFDGPMSTSGLANAVDNLVSDAETPEELTAVVSSLLNQELTDTQFSVVIDSVFDGPMSDENFAAAVDAVFTDTSELSDEQFDTAVQAVFDGPLSTEQFGDALDAVFDEPVTDEKFDAVIDAVLDEPLSDEQFEELVGVLESDTVTEEQVAAAVDSVIENGVTEDQATELATSEKVLESINTEQAEEIFSAIDESKITEEQAAEIIDAVQEAPEEVRETFEDTIDLFGGTFDTYEMVGQTINVQERRTIVAVNLVTATVAAVSATGGLGGTSGGGSSGPTGGSPSDSSKAARREDDGEQEMAGEIASDGVDWVKELSIYTIVNGEKKLNWKAFIKKFWFGVMNLGFTIAGSVVVYFTLSGKIQTIALVSTLLAFTSAMYLHMKEQN